MKNLHQTFIMSSKSDKDQMYQYYIDTCILSHLENHSVWGFPLLKLGGRTEKSPDIHKPQSRRLRAAKGVRRSGCGAGLAITWRKIIQSMFACSPITLGGVRKD